MKSSRAQRAGLKWTSQPSAAVRTYPELDCASYLAGNDGLSLPFAIETRLRCKRDAGALSQLTLPATLPIPNIEKEALLSKSTDKTRASVRKDFFDNSGSPDMCIRILF